MPSKPIVILAHARFEMQRRNVTDAEVDAVVRNPGQIIPAKKGRQIYQSKIAGGKVLMRVVVKEEANAYLVVTVYPTSKVAKYWRQP